jgi:ornithine cyclodeaminase
MLIAGAGRVGSMTSFAFRKVRPINEVQVWDLNAANSGKLIETLKSQGFKASIADDLETAQGQADINSCAALSNEPLIKFEWLRPGAHLDLIGSFPPHMSEADNACFANGSVYIDPPDALKKSSDLICPKNDGVMQASNIIGTLSDLCRGQTPARTSRDQITIYKTVGTGLSDLAAGALAYKNLTA